jgi:FRG domain
MSNKNGNPTVEVWLNDIPENDRQRVTKLYSKARNFQEKVEVLKEWHPKGHVTLKPIRNLEEYFKYIKLLSTESTWFRGESKDYGHLIPKLYRGIESDKIEKQLGNERKYFLEFRRRARSLAPSISPSDTWAWYFLVQHYGGPTRLLDWTEDAAIALFFALDSNTDETDNPIVIILQPTVLATFVFKEINEENHIHGSVLYPGEFPTEKWISNMQKQNDSLNAEIPNAPIALLPPHSDARITAQRSCFTLFGRQFHGFCKNGQEILCPCCDRKIIIRLVIDGRSKKELRKELTRIGITSGKVYPGLDGLCKEISEEILNAK